MSEQIVQHMGAFIKARRSELGLTLDEVAKRSGATKSHIWQLERQQSSNPTIKMALALCDALQCSLNSLIGVDVSQPRFTDQEMALIAAHRAIFAELRQ